MTPTLRNHSFFVLALALVASLAALGPGLWGLDPDKVISQFNHRVWQDELPQGTVHTITQTRDGYLWLGTYEGLVRFDGVDFTVYDSAHTESLSANKASDSKPARDLPASTVYDLHEDRSGRLWIATNGGLAWLEEGVFSSITTADGLPSNYVTVTREGPDGSLWVGTDHGICRLVVDGERPRCLPVEAPAVAVRTLAVDSDRVLWVATDQGLGRYEEGRGWEMLTTADGLPHDLCRAVMIDGEGTMWVGTNGGLAAIRGNEISVLTTEDGLPDSLVREILEDRDGNLWVGTEDSGLSRLLPAEPPSFETFGTTDGFSNDFVRSIFEDREGNLWVGTNGGLNQIRDGKLTTFTRSEGLSHDFVRAVFEDRQERLWVGTYGGGLNLLENGQWSAYTTAEGLANNSVLAIAQTQDDAIWVGTRNGLSRMDPSGFRSFTSRDGLSHDIVRTLLEDREGNLWVGTEGGGLDRYRRGAVDDAGEWSNWTTEDGLAGNDVRSLLEDREGRLWIGTFGGLSRLDYGVLTRFSTADGLSNDQIFELYEDSEGLVWIGTDVGLNLYRDGRFFAMSTESGLFDNKVFRILEDDFGFFWMSSNRGISKVARADLLRLADGEIDHVEVDSFTKSDGMKANQCNGASQPAGWKTRSGLLWFPTALGAVRIDPGDLKVNRLAPPVTIEHAVAGTEKVEPKSGTEFDPGLRRFEFHYAALSFMDPERVQFKYRLEGFDSEWQNAGARRTAYYTNLLPGAYQFRVIAANNDGIWNEDGASFDFVVQTPIWARTWAIVLYLLILVGVARAGLRWRLRALQRQNRLLETAVTERTAELDEKSEALFEKVRQLQTSERRAHASERQALEANRAKTVFLSNMSHELRTPLNSIIGFSSILDSKLGENLQPKQRRFLQNIHGSGEHLLGLINDLLDLSKIEAGRMDVIVEKLDVLTVLTEVRDLMRGVTEERRIEIHLEVPEDLQEIESDTGKFRQIVLNLISNAVKFSSSDSSVMVRAGGVHEADSPLGRDSVRVDVIDEGIGISEDDRTRIFEAFRQADGSSSRSYQGTGLGLALIKRLLEIQGGTVELESELGKGSTFSIYLPCSPVSSPSSRRTPAVRPELSRTDVEGEVRVLVVEDDPAAYHAIAATLEAEGFLVDSARDGKEALQRFGESPPDLVTLDLVLPGLDGWEVLKEIKSRPESHEIPIVIVSVREGRDLGLALGAADFFVKPIEPEGFLRRIRELVTGRLLASVRESKILVIDDEPQAHELIEAILEPLQIGMTRCLDGPSGLQAARSELPDVVILDLMMPGMSGFEVADELREDPRTADIPVVVLTAKELTTADREFLSGRITKLVEKGQNAHALLPQVIRDLVERR